MLVITGLYKEYKQSILNHISLRAAKGQIVSIECGHETSDLLFNLVLGRLIPGKGDILLHTASIGVVLRDEGLYERMTVRSYMQLFSQLVNSKVHYKDVLLNLALLDQAHVPIKELSYSQRKRLSFAREILKSPELLLFQEPLINMSKEDVRVILENIEALCCTGTAVLGTSVSFREALLLGGTAYRIDTSGIAQLQPEEHQTEVSTEKGERPRSADYTVAKIPAKLEDRILLFDPAEIDFIETQQSVSQLHVRGELFVTTLSLNELEERLKHFGFFRCHRSYLVNLQRVREVITFTRNSYSLSLDDKNKTTIPLAKGRVDDLRSILAL